MSEITPEKLIAWAEERVQTSPTYQERTWDEQLTKAVEKDRANSVEHELADLLLQYAYRDLDGYKAVELRDILAKLYRDGTKGYFEMTRDELLDQIEEDIIQAYLEDLGYEQQEWEKDNPAERSPNRPVASWEDLQRQILS